MTTRTALISAAVIAASLLLIWQHQRMHGAYDYEPVHYEYAPVVRR